MARAAARGVDSSSSFTVSPSRPTLVLKDGLSSTQETQKSPETQEPPATHEPDPSKQSLPTSTEGSHVGHKPPRSLRPKPIVIVIDDSPPRSPTGDNDTSTTQDVQRSKHVRAAQNSQPPRTPQEQLAGSPGLTPPPAPCWRRERRSPDPSENRPSETERGAFYGYCLGSNGLDY